MPVDVYQPRESIPKSKIHAQFSTARTQSYVDTNAPGVGSSSTTTTRNTLNNNLLPSSSTSLPGNVTSTASLTASAANNSTVIRTLAWSPTGALIATADSRILRVWNPERPSVRYSTELRSPPSETATAPAPPAGRIPARPPGPQHVAGTERVAWNPTRESELASVGSDGTVRFWDVRNKNQLAGEVKFGGEGFSMAWRPNGQELVVGTKDDTLIKIDRRGLVEGGRYKQTVQTNQIAFSNGGATLFVPMGDGSVRLLDYPSMDEVYSINAHTSSAYVASPCPRGRNIAAGGSDAIITITDTTDYVCKRTLAEMIGPVRSLSFTFDGNYIAGGSDEGKEILIAHVETGDYVYQIDTANPPLCVAWHPSRYWLAYSGDPGVLKIFGGGGGMVNDSVK